MNDDTSNLYYFLYFMQRIYVLRICCVCAAYVLRCAGYVLQTCCICAAYVTYLFFSKANDVIMGAVSEGFTRPAHRDLHHGTS